jgi:hypothetical protein
MKEMRSTMKETLYHARSLSDSYKSGTRNVSLYIKDGLLLRAALAKGK